MKSNFVYHSVTTEEAINLIESYRRTGAKVEKTLCLQNPQLWDVSVVLPEQGYLPPTPYSMTNRMWG